MVKWRLQAPLILASGSETRRSLLEAVGIPTRPIKPDVDERQIEARFQNLEPMEIAVALAKAKSSTVSDRYRSHWVLGCDQILEHDGAVVHKAADRGQAIEKIARLSASSHVLHSAGALYYENIEKYIIRSTVRLDLKKFSRFEIVNYVDGNIKNNILSSVGSYHFEGNGIDLISGVQGEKTTIMGLPILDLIKALYDMRLIVLS